MLLKGTGLILNLFLMPVEIKCVLFDQAEEYLVLP